MAYSAGAFSLTRRRAFLILCAPVVLYFAPLLFWGEVFYLTDTGLYFYPHKAMIAEALRAGHLPQWNPHEFGGMPLVVDSNFNVFHPLSLITYLVPMPLGFSLFIAAHALIAAAGMTWLARAWGAPRGCALLAGLTFAWSGPFVSWCATGQLVVLAYLPWLCLAAVRFAQSPSRLTFAGGAIAAALVLLSGTPEVGACGFVLAALGVAQVRANETAQVRANETAQVRADETAHAHAVAATRAAETLPRAATPPPHAWPLALGLAATWLSGALLAAVQLLPTALYARHSSRAGGFAFAHATQFSLYPGRLPELFFPAFKGSIAAPEVLSWSLHPGMGRGYVLEIALGALPMSLALWGAFSRRRLTWLLFGAAVFLWIAFGAYNPISAWLWRVMPLFRNIRFPEKFIEPAAFVLSLHVAFGAWSLHERWLARPRLGTAARGLDMLLAGAALAALAAAALHLFGGAWLAARLGPERAACFRATAGVSLVTECSFLALACAVVWLALRDRLRPSLARGLLLALFAADLAFIALGLRFTIPAEELTAPSPLEALLGDDAHRDDPTAPLWAWRFDVMSQITEGDLAALGAPDWPRPRRHFWLRRLAMYDAPRALYGAKGYSGFTASPVQAFYTKQPSRAVFDMLSTKYVIEVGTGERENTFDHRDLSPLPIAPPLGDVLKIWKNPRALPRVTLRDSQSGEITPSAGTARVSDYAPERVTIEVELSEKARVVLNDTALDGWAVRVDGEPATPVAHAGAFRAVEVLAGRHMIAWAYTTPGLYAGSLISGFALAGLLGLLSSWRRRGAGAQQVP